MTTTDSRTPPRRLGPAWLGIDLPAGRAQPAWWRWLVAALIAGVLSVAACGILAAAGTAADPAAAGYEHFRFPDYAKLTIAGVIAAVIVWPIITLLSSRAGRLYVGISALALVASFAPDLWILHGGQPPIAVAFLGLMHVAVAAITVAAILVVAPQRRRRDPAVA